MISATRRSLLCQVIFLLCGLLAGASAHGTVAARANIIAPSQPTFDVLPEGAEEVAVELFYSDLVLVIPTIIVGDKIFVRPTDVFSLGGVKCAIASDELSFSGFFLEEENTFRFDASTRTFTCGDEEWTLTKDQLLLLDGGGYFERKFLEQALKIKLPFSFSALGLGIVSEVDLPIVEIKRRENSRKSKQAITAGERAEFYYPLSRRWASAGALDWSYSSSYAANKYSDSYYGRLGAQLLGGDLEASGSGTTNRPFNWREADYRWRYFIGSSFVNEVLVGSDLGGGARRTTADSGISVRLSNRSNEFRNSFSTYKIHERTEPRWTVELYLNGLLVDYTKADDDGYYSFDIPLGYGSSEITQKFYGAFGELRIEESKINVPYSFMPPGEIEYSLTTSSPFETPNKRSILGKADLKLGVASFLTIGGGALYDYQALGEKPVRAIANFSLRPFSELLISGNYYDKAGFDATFNWPLFWGIDLSGSYERPFAHPVSFEGAPRAERRKLQLQSPFIGGNIRLAATEEVITSSTSSADVSASISSTLFDIPLSFSGEGSVSREATHVQFNSARANGSFALRLFEVYVKPEISYDIMKREFTTASLRLQRSIDNAVFVSMGINRDMKTGASSGNLELKFNLGVAQLSTGAGVSEGNSPNYNSGVSGGLIYDPYAGGFAVSERGMVGRGGAIVRGFIDTDDDGSYTEGEKLVDNFDVSGAGYTTIIPGVGTRLDNLEPYSTRIVKPNLGAIENISLLPKYKSIGIISGANGMSVIDFPMYIAGQIGGYVNFKKDTAIEPAAGVRMLVMRLSDSTLMSFDEDFLTYESGEFFNVGLMPGKYAIAPDALQLAKLKLEAEPKYREFYLRSIEEGDMVENLNFDIVPATPGSQPLAFGKAAVGFVPAPTLER